MKNLDNKLVLGLLLVAGGTFFLLQNIGLFAGLGALFGAMAFGAAGLVFLYLFITDFDARWWAAIPGMVLLGLAGAAILSEFGFGPVDDFAGPFFLAAIGTGFALVFLVKPEFWWAIIPGGALYTLAAVAAVDEMSRGLLDSGGVFFIGLGLTFLVLALLPKAADRDLRWAYIPAGILMVMGFFIGTPLIGWIGTLWPVALILGGIYLIVRRRSVTL
jgi:hypothetical protein